jgi:hypothetical protein
MFSTLRTRFGIPGVISVMALVFAMFGGAYAASNSSEGGKATASAKGKKGPRGPKGATGPAGPAGPAGPQGPAGAKGEPGAAGADGNPGAAGASVKSSIAPPEPAHCETGGSKFVAGATTTYACNGGEGPPGPEGSPWTNGGTLPPGATLTGIWGSGGSTLLEPPPILHEGLNAFPISFPIPLEAEPERVRVNEGETSKPGCPGVIDGVPTADPGKFCLYVTVLKHGEWSSFQFPMTAGSEGYFEEGAITPTGTLAVIECESDECAAGGTWAVTAPEP